MNMVKQLFFFFNPVINSNLVTTNWIVHRTIKSKDNRIFKILGNLTNR